MSDSVSLSLIVIIDTIGHQVLSRDYFCGSCGDMKNRVVEKTVVSTRDFATNRTCCPGIAVSIQT